MTPAEEHGIGTAGIIAGGLIMGGIILSNLGKRHD